VRYPFYPLFFFFFLFSPLKKEGKGREKGKGGFGDCIIDRSGMEEFFSEEVFPERFEYERIC